MPQSQRSRILSLAVGTAAASGLGMIPVHRLPRPVRAGYVALPAVLTTGVSLLAQQGRPDPAAGAAPRAPGLRPPPVPAAAPSRAARPRRPATTRGPTAGGRRRSPRPRSRSPSAA